MNEKVLDCLLWIARYALGFAPTIWGHMCTGRPPPTPFARRRAAPDAHAPRMTCFVHCSLVSCLLKLATWMFFFMEAG